VARAPSTAARLAACSAGAGTSPLLRWTGRVQPNPASGRVSFDWLGTQATFTVTGATTVWGAAHATDSAALLDAAYGITNLTFEAPVVAPPCTNRDCDGYEPRQSWYGSPTTGRLSLARFSANMYRGFEGSSGCYNFSGGHLPAIDDFCLARVLAISNDGLDTDAGGVHAWGGPLAGGAFVGVLTRSSAFNYLGEKLTRRLRAILEQYSEGASVLHEYVQNADDAGASVVRILFNLRSYGTRSLLSPKLAEWQGPSLLVYNDAQFSSRDFANLARIGQASKLERLDATGRFGLGFCAAYHLTDVPQLVSGSDLVMFDPHAAFVPGATIAQPAAAASSRARASIMRTSAWSPAPRACAVGPVVPMRRQLNRW
jgi:hypothetical protein